MTVVLQGDEWLLRVLARKCKDAREKVRYLALHALSRGYAVSSVAEIFCVDEATIYRWIERWQAERNLADQPKEGRPPKLAEKDKKEIKKLVEENDPKRHGVNASFWDCKELRLYLLSTRGKNVSQETIRRCLRSMGAHYVKAEIEYAEADEGERENFAQRFLQDLASKPDSVVVLFQDEMSVKCSPRKGYGWTFGERLVVKAPQTDRRRMNCFGAVNPLEGRVVQMTTKKEAKAPAFVRFLRRITREYPEGGIWVYADNLRVHKSEKVERFLQKHPRLELRFLPTHSPDLNPQDQWWNFERKKLLNNRYFATPHQLATAISWFGRNTPPERVTSVCALTPIENLLVHQK
nr:IS630 family transposase [Candidatus Freyarchaeota archaeon]